MEEKYLQMESFKNNYLNSWSYLKKYPFEIILVIVAQIILALIPFVSFFNYFFSMGTFFCLSKILNDQELKFVDYFHAMRSPRVFFKSLGLQIIILILFVVCLLPVLFIGYYFLQNSAVKPVDPMAYFFIGLSTLLCFIPMLLFTFSFHIFIIEDTGVFEAISLSYSRVKAQWVKVFKFYLKCFVFNLLGLLCFGVGIFFTVIVTNLLLVNFYFYLRYHSIKEA